MPLSTKKSGMGNICGLILTTETMQPQIWENFPKDLFEEVLARLPIATIIRFRSVCLQWNNLITSQRFSQRCVQVSQANPWFCITFGVNYTTMYDPFVDRWYCLNKVGTPVLPVSSAGSLVCFLGKFCQYVYVCNPLIQCFKKLPAGSIKRFGRLGMTVNGIGGYKVLRLDLCYREYEIYDSVTKNWGYLGKLPEYIIELNNISFNPVSIDDTLYFMHFGLKGIVSCNTSTGVWAQHLVQVPLDSSFLSLAESDGRIMLVGMLIENDARFLCIWEVQKFTFLVKEVDRFRCSESYGNYLRDLTCWGNKGLLLCCFKSYTMYHIVLYNIATRKWEKVRVPFREELLAKKGYVFGTAFQPSLTAMP